MAVWIWNSIYIYIYSIDAFGCKNSLLSTSCHTCLGRYVFAIFEHSLLLVPPRLEIHLIENYLLDSRARWRCNVSSDACHACRMVTTFGKKSTVYLCLFGCNHRNSYFHVGHWGNLWKAGMGECLLYFRGHGNNLVHLLVISGLRGSFKVFLFEILNIAQNYITLWNQGIF